MRVKAVLPTCSKRSMTLSSTFFCRKSRSTLQQLIHLTNPGLFCNVGKFLESPPPPNGGLPNRRVELQKQ